jgi:type IV pilus assembly protein PilB
MPSSDDTVLEMLSKVGLINDDDITEAKLKSVEQGMGVVESLISSNVITQTDVTKALASHFGMEFISLRDMVIPEEVIATIPRDLAKRYRIVPVYKHDNTISVALSDPMDIDVVDSLRYALKSEIEPLVAPEKEIDEALLRYYGGAEETVDKMLQEITQGEIDVSTKKEGEGELHVAEDADAPIIRLCSLILNNAFRTGASDIHIEPLEKDLRVRHRIDGVLHKVDGPPKKLQSSLMQRLKIMAGMSISERRLPQDGRIKAKFQEKDLDLRVSCIPTNHGESIVMRILDSSTLKLGLPELGFLSDDQAVIEAVLALPDGIFLVTGPTGCGKTTTLYACLHYVNRPDKKIITVEDPVEYQLQGVNQVPVNNEVGLSFAAALRAMLRQAPNIIMVGEIRDRETANIAINASLTGHFVYSTLHTNDAPGAVSRLADIGVKPFLIGSAIRAVMAQRLIRKVCKNCAEPYEATKVELEALGINASQAAGATMMKGRGCNQCYNRGYKGRIGIFEIFVFNDEVRKIINDGCTHLELKRRARELGMRTLREDGTRKVLSGLTTPEELISSTMETEE